MVADTSNTTAQVRVVNVDQIEQRIYNRGVLVGIVIGMPIGVCLVGTMLYVLKTLSG